MKNKTIFKAIPIILIISGIYLSSASPSYAYWQIFGLQIPTNFEEVKVIIFSKNFRVVDTESEIKSRMKEIKEREVQNNTLDNIDEILEEHDANVDRQAEIEQKNENYRDNSQLNSQNYKKEKQEYAKDKVNKSIEEKMKDLNVLNNVANLGILTITADQIESLINQALVNKTYFNYTIKNVDVRLESGKAYLTLYLNDDKAIELEIVSTGNNLEISNVKSVGKNSLTFIENLALSQGIKSLPSIIDQFVPADYKNKISKITITPEKIIVEFEQ